MNDTRFDEAQLSLHIVRIEDLEDGSVLGTGFFAAPGWVLTCAHVVEDARRPAIAPDPRLAGGSALTATVQARSPGSPDEAFWPFPDLALLRLDREFARPCAPIEAAVPDQDCYAWGFARHGYAGPEWTGVSVVFRDVFANRETYDTRAA